MDIRSERSQGGESKLAFSCASAGGMSVVGVAAVVALIPLAFAQDPPSATEKRRFDSGALQQAQRRANEASQVPGKPVRTVIRTDMPKMLTFVASLKLSVKGFRLEGVADIPSHEIEAVLGQWKGRELSFAEFEKAVHAVARYLRENGHPNAQVKVSQAQVADGMLAIAVQGLSKPQQVAEAVAPPVLPQEVSPRILIKSFRFSGATTTSNEELQKSVSQWANKLLTVDELKQTAEGVAAYLRNKGYTLAQAWLPPQRVDTGELEIAIQEGVVDPQSGTGGLTITGAGKRIAPQVIESILSSSIHPGEPFMSSNLEGALMIANELPGVKSVRANLSPGTSPGTTQIEAQVEETELLTGSVGLDNYNSVYTGQNRLNAALNMNSPAKFGEQYSLALSHASRMDSAKLSVQAPVGIRGAKLGAAVSSMRLDIGREVAPLNLSGQSDIQSLYASYPLLRSATHNNYLSVNLDRKRLINDIAGFRENDRRLGLVTLTNSGDLLDPWQGKMSWSLGLSLGSLDLSHNRNSQILDDANARTAGSFRKANWSFSRVGSIAGDASWSWGLGFSGQAANKNLDGAEKFQLGGPSGVRAYPVGEAIGDSGWLGNLEVRHSFATTALGNPQVFAFVDHGNITQYRDVWGTALSAGRPNSYSLAGYGFGADLGFDQRGGLRLVFAKKMGSNPNQTLNKTDSDGKTSSARLWILGHVLF